MERAWQIDTSFIGQINYSSGRWTWGADSNSDMSQCPSIELLLSKVSAGE